MSKLLDQFNKSQLKDLPNIRPGDTVLVHQKVKEGDKDRIQIFEGIVIAIKHGKGVNATMTVRKVVGGVGVERIFPIHSPLIEKIEVAKSAKVRRAKLYYLREAKGKKARLKQKEFASVIADEESAEIKETLAGSESTEAEIEEKSAETSAEDFKQK